MTRRQPLVFALLAVALATTRSAVAGEPERIHLRIDADPSCLQPRDVPAAVRALGEPFEHARAGERARIFAVTLSQREDRAYDGRVVVDDLGGTRSIRDFSASTCSEARETIALFVSMALDRGELPPFDQGDFIQPSTSVWPTERDAPTHATSWRSAPTGPGGYLFAAQYDAASGQGAQVIYASRMGRLRVGPSIGINTKDASMALTPRWRDARTQQVRPTLALAGGAPWSDFPLGFVAELGLAAGLTEGAVLEEGTRTARGRTELWASPYAAGTLLVQVPWRFDVRPFIAVQQSFTLLRSDQAIGVVAEAGIAWRRW